MDKEKTDNIKTTFFIVLAVLWTLLLPRLATYILLGEIIPIWSTFFLVGYPLILAVGINFFDKPRNPQVFVQKTLAFYIFFNTLFLISGLYKTLPKKNNLASKTFTEVYTIWDNSFFAYDYYMNNYLKSLENNNKKITYGVFSSIRELDRIVDYLELIQKKSLLNDNEVSQEIKKIAIDSLSKEKLVNEFYRKLNFQHIKEIINDETFNVGNMDCAIANDIVEKYIKEENVNHNKFYEILYVFEKKRNKCLNKDLLKKNKTLISKNEDNFWYKKLKDLNPFFDKLLRQNEVVK